MKKIKVIEFISQQKMISGKTANTDCPMNKLNAV